MENQNERNLLRRAELMSKCRDIIAKAAKEKELEREKQLERERQERERELERISKANRAAAVREQNKNEQAMKKRLAVRPQVRFSKEDQRASRRAVKAMKKAVEMEKTVETEKMVDMEVTVAMEMTVEIEKAVEMKKTVEIADGTSKFPLLTAAILELYGSSSFFDWTGLAPGGSED